MHQRWTLSGQVVAVAALVCDVPFCAVRCVPSISAALCMLCQAVQYVALLRGAVLQGRLA
jgi:hypothetical protein